MKTNQIKKIREKLTLIQDKFISKKLLEQILKKFAPSYSIVDICRKKLITPLKRGKYYINNLSFELQDPYETINLYFSDDTYMFGGLGVYNMYGYTTQLAEWYTVYNTKISGNRIIGNVKYIFKKERENFFYGITKTKKLKYNYKVISSERAIIQMYKEGKIFTEVPKNANKEKLKKMSKKYSSKNIYLKIEKLCS